MARSLSGARPRLVWSMTPVALMTGTSDGRPAWFASVSARAGTPAMSSGWPASSAARASEIASRAATTAARCATRGSASVTALATASTLGSDRSLTGSVDGLDSDIGEREVCAERARNATRSGHSPAGRAARRAVGYDSAVTTAPIRLTELTSCGGCASKAGPGWLEAVVGPLAGLFDAERFPSLMLGLSVADDAAVYSLSRTSALVATVDFFAPLVDDPETFGAIAAANAMSDVYAMGGEVAFALNVAAFPQDMDPEVASQVLRGGAGKVAEAGGVIAGGHTIWDDEPKYGLCVLGFVHPRKLFGKANLKPGQQLYLTKPLGTGTILSGARGDAGDVESYNAAIESMLRLN